MKNIYLLLFILSSIHLNAQEWEWLELASGLGEDQGFGVQGGGHYLTSTSENNETFMAFAPSGNVDIFGDEYNIPFASQSPFYKLDENGNTLWSTEVVSEGGSSVPMGVAQDNNGNSYVSGAFNGTLLIDDNNTFSSEISFASYYCKLDNNGDVLWSKAAIPVSSNAIVYINNRLNVSPNGDIVSYMYFKDTISWEGNEYVAINDPETLIIKMDSNGQTQWVRQFAGINGFYIDDILFDDSGHVLLSGDQFLAEEEQGGPPEYNNDLTDDNQTYLMKLDGGSGQGIWHQYTGFDSPSDSIAGTHGVFTRNTEMDEDGNIYQLNRKWGLPDMNIQGNVISNINDREYFITKYDSNGNWIYSKAVLNDMNFNIQMCVAGSDIIIVSTVQENTIFEGTPLNIVGNSDMIISSYDLEGNYKWHYPYGNANADIYRILRLEHGNNGDLFIHGYLEPNKIFAFDDITVSSTAGTNLYIAKYNIPYTSVGLENIFPAVPSLSISPNPASNYLNIDLSDIEISNTGNAHLGIYDALGKEVYKVAINNSQSGYEYLDVQRLAKGIYFIKIDSENEIKAIGKFIKE